MIESHSSMLIRLSGNVKVELQINGSLLELTYEERWQLNQLIARFDELGKLRNGPTEAP